MKIIGIIGSKKSVKTKKALEAVTFEGDVDYKLLDLAEGSWPFADGRDYRDYDEETTRTIQELMDADAIIVGTPVYQASIPGILKNLFDLLPDTAWLNKAVGIVVTAGSANHYLVAEYQLKPILHYLGAAVLEKYIFITPQSFYMNELDDDIHLRLTAFGSDVVQRVQAQKQRESELYDF